MTETLPTNKEQKNFVTIYYVHEKLPLTTLYCLLIDPEGNLVQEPSSELKKISSQETGRIEIDDTTYIAIDIGNGHYIPTYTHDEQWVLTSVFMHMLEPIHDLALMAALFKLDLADIIRFKQSDEACIINYARLRTPNKVLTYLLTDSRSNLLPALSYPESEKMPVKITRKLEIGGTTYIGRELGDGTFLPSNTNEEQWIQPYMLLYSHNTILNNNLTLMAALFKLDIITF